MKWAHLDVNSRGIHLNSSVQLRPKVLTIFSIAASPVCTTAIFMHSRVIKRPQKCRLSHQSTFSSVLQSFRKGTSLTARQSFSCPREERLLEPSRLEVLWQEACSRFGCRVQEGQRADVSLTAHAARTRRASKASHCSPGGNIRTGWYAV